MTFKSKLFSFGVGISMLASSMAMGQDAHDHDHHGHDHRNCQTMGNLDRLLKHNPKAKERMRNIETFTQRYVKQQSDDKNRRTEATVYTIPVVVHVIYNNSTENISDAQIASQMQVLNDDFRKLNADRTQVPAEFAPVAADTEIQFVMATTDPNGNPTNGITRTSTSRTSFGTNDQMKFSAQGGKDAWDTQKYLNMWVCDISGSILGYAQFPGSGSAATDGVVMDYQYFGTIGAATAPFDGGRTTTHEVGHWLNLRHIWGDGNCSQDDFVSDTPTAGAPNYNCPSYPSKSCNNNGGFTSDMFMNYMDYVNDDCMHMFTEGQKSRMRAVLAPGGFRNSLVSGGTTPPPTCDTPTGLAGSSVTETTFTLSWNAVSGASSYDVRLRVNGGSWIPFDGRTTTSINLQGASAGTTYEAQVRANCSSGATAYSSSVFVQTSGGGTTPPPTYCDSKGNSVADEWIQRVQIGSINNNSGSNGGYADFTNLQTGLSANSTYSITITPTWSGRTYREAYAVWIDYNQDGDFTDAGEAVYTRSRTTATSVTGSFTVPSSARNGATRMRVSMKYNANPSSCETFNYGEVEDYTVVISNGSRTSDDATEISVMEGGSDATVVRRDALGTDLFSAYPSPVSRELNIKLGSFDENTELKVYNLMGREMLSKVVDSQQTVLDVSDLPKGMYILNVNNGGKAKTLKFIKE